MKKGRIYVVSFILTVTLIFTIILTNSLKTSANENRSSSERLYSSIMINDGDTLWSIAEEYKPADVSVKDYIKSLKSINGIASDNIQSGNHLIIYYYAD